jgi:hypothetical protein
MILQSFTTGGNQSYPDFWAITGDLWYPGYKTPTVASNPFIERVAGVIHSIGGRIDTHTLLQVPLQDSMVRPWG